MDLASLTVPQLKARCKELKLTGYSKLSRVSLLQKLGASVGSPLASDLIPQSSNSSDENTNILRSNSNHKHDVSLNPGVQDIDFASASSGARLGLIPVVGAPAILQSHPEQRTESFKRKPYASFDTSRKKSKLPETPVSSERTPLSPQQYPYPASPSVLTPLITALAPIKTQKPLTSSLTAKSNPPKLQSTRFLPLVPSQAAVLRHLSANRSKSIDTEPAAKLRYLDFKSTEISSGTLPAIGLPPSLKQRASAQMWAVALRLLTDEDRRQCVLVSRAIRYAVYLSATHIIKQDFGSRRFDVLVQYSQHINNFWPILLHLRADLSRKKLIYQSSFLSSFFASQNPIVGRIWRCTDHDEQLTVAMRYLMTRLWFCFCINPSDKDKLKRSVIVDAQEIVQGEIWLIAVDSLTAKGKRSRDYSYVLYDTCEAIGTLPATHVKEHVSRSRSDMRSDWSLYASSHGQTGSSEGRLLARVKWNNEEEYLTGMSRHWLARTKGEGAVGDYKRKVGTRYVLASVVSNSISGKWMTCSHMAQVFAGRASEDEDAQAQHGTKAPKVNFFLPAHHLVESVHFELRSGEAFHPAIACIRTPDREYFILRDNGMTIGCEEDGIWDHCTELIGCDKRGMKV